MKKKKKEKKNKKEKKKTDLRKNQQYQKTFNLMR